jgi:hypothetical protein
MIVCVLLKLTLTPAGPPLSAENGAGRDGIQGRNHYRASACRTVQESASVQLLPGRRSGAAPRNEGLSLAATHFQSTTATCQSQNACNTRDGEWQRCSASIRSELDLHSCRTTALHVCHRASNQCNRNCGCATIPSVGLRGFGIRPGGVLGVCAILIVLSDPFMSLVRLRFSAEAS